MFAKSTVSEPLLKLILVEQGSIELQIFLSEDCSWLEDFTTRVFIWEYTTFFINSEFRMSFFEDEILVCTN